MSGTSAKVLFLAGHPASAAAPRFRAVAYFEALRRRGIEPELSTFLDDAAFEEFYAAGRYAKKAANVMSGLARQMSRMLGDYAAVFVQREAMLLGPPLVEAVLHHRSVPLVFDFDDAIWLSSHERSVHPVITRLVRNPGKTRSILRFASSVFAGNDWLAAYARQHAKRVTVLRTVVSAETWKPLPGRLEERVGVTRPVIGWIGTHSTAPQLELVAGALTRLAAAGFEFELRVVGGRAPHIPGVRVEERPWRLDREVEEFQTLEIGLAPLFDDLWSLGKCAFKQIQYMAAGVPFVSSPVGAARQLLTHDETALFAGTSEDWEHALGRLLRSPELRRSLAVRARQVFEQRYSLEVQSPIFVDEIMRVLRKRGSGEARGAAASE